MTAHLQKELTTRWLITQALLIIRTYPKHIILAIILGVQLCLALPSINAPFIDGAQHTTHDNAFFLERALHSNDTSIPFSLKNWLGVTFLTTQPDHSVSVAYYNNAPPFIPFLFRLFTKLFGYSEFVPRLFMLLFTGMVTSALFFLLTSAMRQLFIPSILLVVYVLSPIQIAYIAQFKLEFFAESLFVVALFCYYHFRTSQESYFWFFAAFFLSLISGFNVFIPGTLLLLYLVFWDQRVDFKTKRIAIILYLSALLVNSLVLFNLGHSPQTLYTELLKLIQLPSQFSFFSYLIQQITLFNINFLSVHLYVFVPLLLYVIVQKKYRSNLLIVFGLIYSSSVILSVLLFKSYFLSYNIAQFQFIYAYIFLIAGLLYSESVLSHFLKSRPAILTLFIPFFAISIVSASHSLPHISDSPTNTENDLKSVSKVSRDLNTLYYFNSGISGDVTWWQSPAIRFYSDDRYQTMGYKNAIYMDIKPVQPSTFQTTRTRFAFAVKKDNNSLSLFKKFLEATFQYQKNDLQLLSESDHFYFLTAQEFMLPQKKQS